MQLALKHQSQISKDRNLDKFLNHHYHVFDQIMGAGQSAPVRQGPTTIMSKKTDCVRLARKDAIHPRPIAQNINSGALAFQIGILNRRITRAIAAKDIRPGRVNKGSKD